MSDIKRTKGLVAPKVDKGGHKVTSRGTVDIERMERKVDAATMKETQKSRMKGIIAFFAIDIVLLGFLVYQIVSIFKTIIEHIPQ